MSSLVDIAPKSMQELKLGEWASFCIEYGINLDKDYATIAEMPEGVIKHIELAQHSVERMYCLAAHFSHVPLPVAKRKYRMGEVLEAQEKCFAHLFDGSEDIQLEFSFPWKEQVWTLPPVELMPGAKLTFGEFIDAKVIVQDVKAQEQTRWELIHQIAAIFLRPEGEEYSDALIMPDSPRLELLKELPMHTSLIVGEWFDQFNKFLEAHFEVFSESKIRGGSNMKKHFEKYGWVHFLKSIASTHVFDIPSSGLNSIECARRAPCFDVLYFASEEKSYNEAQYFDLEAQKK